MVSKSKVFIFGKSGRMGQEICSVLSSHSQAECCGGRTSSGDEGLVSEADVLIDFSVPQALSYVLDLAVSQNKPLVIGTTGLDLDHMDAIKKASEHIPIIQASNTSLGIAILAKITQEVAKVLDETFDIEIAETHHRHKIDAPSGTALSLAESAAKGRSQGFDRNSINMDRRGPRNAEIGFSVRRGGGVIGDHTVAFIGKDEMIELSHRGLSRRLFAQGAIKAALWLIHRPAGNYSMAEVLGI